MFSFSHQESKQIIATANCCECFNFYFLAFMNFCLHYKCSCNVCIQEASAKYTQSQILLKTGWIEYSLLRFGFDKRNRFHELVFFLIWPQLSITFFFEKQVTRYFIFFLLPDVATFIFTKTQRQLHRQPRVS